jgi:hypothetical protein
MRDLTRIGSGQPRALAAVGDCGHSSARAPVSNAHGAIAVESESECAHALMKAACRAVPFAR